MRKTYIDNNGFERYEDTCKIVPNQPDNKEILSEVYKIFANPKTNNSTTYEELNYLESKCIYDGE